MEVNRGSDIPDEFTIDGIEYTKSVTKEDMCRWKDQNGNTGYISKDEVEKHF
jgi:hypothetical protein